MTGPTLVIPCSGSKLEHAAPARDLYTGQMFRYALAKCSGMAEQLDGRVVILSALHGLVELDEQLEPYDRTLKRGRTDLELAFRVRGQLLEDRYADVHVVKAFLPIAYLNVLDYAARTVSATGLRAAVEVDWMLGGCRGIGEQRGRIAELARMVAADRQLAGITL